MFYPAVSNTPHSTPIVHYEKPSWYYIPALSKFNGNVIAEEFITVVGKNEILKSSGKARAINSTHALKIFLELKYCEIFGDKVIVSEKGKAFADYLHDEGFVPVSINEIKI